MKWKGYESKEKGLMYESEKILEDYGDPITLRQLFYRLVGKDLIQNKENNYKYLSKAIKKARLEGVIGWGEIEDRTRDPNGGDWSKIGPEERLKRALEEIKELPEYHIRPIWEDQDNYLEVWVEKEALGNIVSSITSRWGVLSFAGKGYSSWSSLKEARDRFMSYPDREKYLFYLGDFDPSGKDITRFVREALNDKFRAGVNIQRIALTKDQIDKYELPPQPAKSSDSRYEDFVKKHGNIAVELDALDPEVLKDLIERSIKEKIDFEVRERIKEKEKEEREFLREKVNEIFKSIPEGKYD